MVDIVAFIATNRKARIRRRLLLIALALMIFLAGVMAGLGYATYRIMQQPVFGIPSGPTLPNIGGAL